MWLISVHKTAKLHKIIITFQEEKQIKMLQQFLELIGDFNEDSSHIAAVQINTKD